MSYRIIYKGDINKQVLNTYKCKCGVKIEKYSKMCDITSSITCECGEIATIVIELVNIYTSKSDPHAHNYWQKGLSTLEIAQVYSNEREPY